MFEQRGRKTPDLSLQQAAQDSGETKAEAKEGLSILCQDVKYYMKERSPKAFKNFCVNLLTQYEKGLISKEYLREFFLGSYVEGMNGLQWLLSQKGSQKARIILWMLNELKRREVFSQQEVLSLVTQVNGFGRNAYDYALLSESAAIYFAVGNLLYKAVEDHSLPVEQFHQVLSHKDGRGKPVLAKVLQLSDFRLASFYFYQWEKSLGEDLAAWRRFAEVLTAPFLHRISWLQTLPQTPLYEILDSEDPRKLELYFKQLRLCFGKGVLTEGRCFQALSASKSPGINALQYIHKFRPRFLEVYLRELLACAEQGMVPIPDLLALFKSLALPLPPSEFPRDVPRKMQFEDPRLSACVDSLLERLQAGMPDLVETLPGLRWFNQRMAAATAKQQKTEGTKLEYKRS